MDKNSIFNKAIENYGPELQTIVAIEELSELQKELTKYLRGKNNKESIIEEITDVEIMLVQIKLMCDITNDEVDKEWNKKIDRLKELLK